MKSLNYCDFVWENEELYAVNKHCGVLSVPGRLGAKDPRPCLSQYLRQEVDASLMPVHRLDFEVSGLMIFAKGPQAHKKLNQDFEHRKVQKTYLAISSLPDDAEENLRQTSSHIQDWTNLLVRGKKRTFIAPHGKSAKTQACLLKYSRKGSWALWRLRPLTGYTHQLRVQLSHQFHPILGDTRYGGTSPSGNLDFIALFSTGINWDQEKLDAGTKKNLLPALAQDNPFSAPLSLQLPPLLIDAWMLKCQSTFALADFQISDLVALL